MSSSVVIIILMLFFPYFGLCQNWTRADVEARDLRCWECDTDGTGGFCKDKHDGKLILCPPPDYPRDSDVDTLDAYKCWIMVVTAEDRDDNVEVMKGCSSIAYGFLEGADNQIMPAQPENGCSEKIEAEFQVGETKRWYQITMCFCNTTNCNKDAINETGKAIIAADESLASSLFIPLWLQLCCVIMTGLVVGILGN